MFFVLLLTGGNGAAAADAAAFVLFLFGVVCAVWTACCGFMLVLSMTSL